MTSIIRRALLCRVSKIEDSHDFTTRSSDARCNDRHRIIEAMETQIVPLIVSTSGFLNSMIRHFLHGIYLSNKLVGVIECSPTFPEYQTKFSVSNDTPLEKLDEWLSKSLWVESIEFVDWWFPSDAQELFKKSTGNSPAAPVSLTGFQRFFHIPNQSIVDAVSRRLTDILLRTRTLNNISFFGNNIFQPKDFLRLLTHPSHSVRGDVLIALTSRVARSVARPLPAPLFAPSVNIFIASLLAEKVPAIPSPPPQNNEGNNNNNNDDDDDDVAGEDLQTSDSIPSASPTPIQNNNINLNQSINYHDQNKPYLLVLLERMVARDIRHDDDAARIFGCAARLLEHCGRSASFATIEFLLPRCLWGLKHSTSDAVLKSINALVDSVCFRNIERTNQLLFHYPQFYHHFIASLVKSRELVLYKKNQREEKRRNKLLLLNSAIKEDEENEEGASSSPSSSGMMTTVPQGKNRFVSVVFSFIKTVLRHRTQVWRNHPWMMFVKEESYKYDYTFSPAKREKDGEGNYGQDDDDEENEKANSPNRFISTFSTADFLKRYESNNINNNTQDSSYYEQPQQEQEDISTNFLTNLCLDIYNLKKQELFEYNQAQNEIEQKILKKHENSPRYLEYKTLLENGKPAFTSSQLEQIKFHTTLIDRIIRCSVETTRYLIESELTLRLEVILERTKEKLLQAHEKIINEQQQQNNNNNNNQNEHLPRVPKVFGIFVDTSFFGRVEEGPNFLEDDDDSASAYSIFSKHIENMLKRSSTIDLSGELMEELNSNDDDNSNSSSASPLSIFLNQNGAIIKENQKKWAPRRSFSLSPYLVSTFSNALQLDNFNADCSVNFLKALRYCLETLTDIGSFLLNCVNSMKNGKFDTDLFDPSRRDHTSVYFPFNELLHEFFDTVKGVVLPLIRDGKIVKKYFNPESFEEFWQEKNQAIVYGVFIIALIHGIFEIIEVISECEEFKRHAKKKKNNNDEKDKSPYDPEQEEQSKKFFDFFKREYDFFIDQISLEILRRKKSKKSSSSDSLSRKSDDTLDQRKNFLNQLEELSVRYSRGEETKRTSLTISRMIIRARENLLKKNIPAKKMELLKILKIEKAKMKHIRRFDKEWKLRKMIYKKYVLKKKSPSSSSKKDNNKKNTKKKNKSKKRKIIFSSRTTKRYFLKVLRSRALRIKNKKKYLHDLRNAVKEEMKGFKLESVFRLFQQN